ncbi:MAG: prepilin peptidase [Pseudomonadota bacterium]|nr:prepilin peptidase [Pseudomonadota bacterium]MEC9104939.1 prepilin peptidase [Pseudomonadota bacterium]
MLGLAPDAARVFLPFVALIGLYVSWTDLRGMRIPNASVLLLAGVFVVVGPFVLPLDIYGPRLLHLVAILVLGFALSVMGVMGAGDAKFLAAAAPFVALADLRLMFMLLAATMLAAFVTHRVIKRTPLRRLAPDWESWRRDKDFPMGTALSTALTLYVALAAFS